MEFLELRRLLSAPEIQVLNTAGMADIPCGTGGLFVFGTSPVALGSQGQQDFLIRNNGNAYLSLTAFPHVSITGDSDFQVVQSPSGSIAPSLQTTGTIGFTPTSKGTHWASVSIPNNDSDENPFTFTLGGFCVWGTQPDLVLDRRPAYPESLMVQTIPGGPDKTTAYYTDNIYVTGQFANAGTASAGPFAYSILVDGVVKSTSQMTSAMAPGASVGFLNLALGKLSPGTHTIQLVLDSGNAVAEGDETDNVRTRTLTVLPPSPDLSFSKPAFWSDEIVVSTHPGGTLDDSPLYASQNIYLDCIVANGPDAPAGPFETRLLVDGVVRKAWTATSLAVTTEIPYMDFNIGMLSAGTHTIKVVTDATNAVTERDETNNSYTRNINVLPFVPPDLAFTNYGSSSLKLPISTTAGSDVDLGTFYSNQTLYGSFAVTNQGIGDAGSFTTRLLVDGTVRSSVDALSLPHGYGQSTGGVDLGTLTAGTHTIQVITDTGNTVTETDETNNSFTRTITVLPPVFTDLTMYQPAGWSDKVVISTNAGDNIDDAVIYDDQTVYLDHAIANIGTGAAGPFVTQVVVDGFLRKTWNLTSLAAGASSTVQDYALAKLAAGTHTIKFTVDAANAVAESNETNNNRTRSITVLHRGLPDLNMVQPASWSDKMILSTNAGDNVDDVAGGIYDDQDLYLDAVVANIGQADAAASSTQLWVDGALKISFSTSAIAQGAQQVLSDKNIGKLTAGTHTLQVRADGGGAIAESNEANNNRTRTITILPRAQADLTMALPAGWSDKMIVSTNSGDNADDSPLHNDQNLYIDFAVGNIGSASVGSFVTSLYVDGVLKQSWTTTSLAAGTQRVILDFNLGKLSAGTHTLKLTADSAGAITELNELNNNRTRAIAVL